MKRLLIACAVLVASVLPASAQLTTMPNPLIAWLDDQGALLDEGGLCVFVAGTSTLATTYTTAAGSVANSNPVLFNSAGRAASGGVFLTPGQSYKFLLKDFTGVVSPTCVPDTGVTIFSVDNITATPASSVNIDVPGTAGVSFTAGELAYISDGSGALVAGSWYKTDADFTYASTTPQIGFAVNDTTAGNTGSFRLVGRMTGLTGLSPGSTYYISATPGALTSSAPTNTRLVGEADTSTSLVFGMPPNLTTSQVAAIIDPRIKTLSNGRLTLSTGVPVTVGDVTAATTVYWTPYLGNEIALYSGTAWVTFAQAELSVAVPSTTNTAYDVFVTYSAGVPALSVTAWTNLTTRATALTTQDGIYVLTGDATQRYVGSFRTTGVSGQTESSAVKRYLWNYYNRVDLELFVADATASWTYTTATIRQARATSTNQVEVMVGVQEVDLDLTLHSSAANTTGVSVATGIGEDSTSTFATGAASFKSGADIGTMTARLVKKPAVGSHTYSWNEWSAAAGTSTFYGSQGDSTPAGVASGIRGRIGG